MTCPSFGTIMQKTKSICSAAALLTLSRVASYSADVEHGRHLAERWCAFCHVVSPDQQSASADVPPLATIAQSLNFDGVDAAAKKTGCGMKILMDLAGPKIRTGAIRKHHGLKRVALGDDCAIAAPGELGAVDAKLPAVECTLRERSPPLSLANASSSTTAKWPRR
jgi:hypothetical protein